MEAQKLHMNKAQMEVMAIDANTETCIAGRGVGKSTFIIAPRAIRCAFDMPQSLGLMVAKSFMQLKTKTLPPVVEGWRLMGYKRNVDYVIGKRGPAHWKEPYFMPEDLRNFIHFRNGSGILMISMEREGSANGISSDWIIVDEAKFLKRERFASEILPTLRGSTAGAARVLWMKKALYKSIMYCTDMPMGTQANWLFEYEALMDREQVKAIEYYFFEMQKKMVAMYESTSDSYKERLRKEIITIQNILDDLRKDCVHYSEASALDNLEVLGLSYLKQMQQELSPILYRTSVLNERMRRVENGFYPHFDPGVHGEIWSDDEYLDECINEVGYDLNKLSQVSADCRADAGINKSAPLEVGLDNGGNFNCVVTGQPFTGEYRVHSGMHVLNPKLVRDLAQKWCDYYKYHPTKEQIYYYDHTAIPKHGTSVDTYKTQWINTMNKNGWKVTSVYIGKTSDYEVRHSFWTDLLRGHRKDLPTFKYSIPHCESLEISVMNAGTKEGRNGLEKDKSSEDQRTGTKPQHATHYSDALDTLVFGSIKKGRKLNRSIGAGVI